MSGLISGVENMIADVKARVTGEITSSLADSVKKSVGLSRVSAHLSVAFPSNKITWDQLDTQELGAVGANVSELVLAEDYESAALGLVYLIYQKEVELTNKTEVQASPNGVDPTSTILASSVTSVTAATTATSTSENASNASTTQESATPASGS